MWRACLTGVWLAASTAAFGLEPTTSQVLASAWIPSAVNIHGETRILRDEHFACVQTILHSPSFRRGIKEILAREAAVWPEGRIGYEDSMAYRAELERVKQLVLDEPRTEADLGKPYTMIMEFRFQPGASAIVFLRAEVEKNETTFHVNSSEELSRLLVSDDYMSRAMLIMTTAALGEQRHDIMPLLESAGWVDMSAQVDPDSVIPAH